MRVVKKLAFILLFTIALPVLAQPDTVMVGDQGMNKPVERPTNGMSETQVASKYGEPSVKTSAVGNPPISKWQYEAFTVYFENGRVIHSVLNVGRSK